MELNLTNQATVQKPQYFVAISDDGEIESSKEEMLQIIESMRTEISYLKKKVKTAANEKESLVENFKMSSGVLLERIKDLEACRDPNAEPGERPQTSTVLSKIGKYSSILTV